MIYLLTIFLIFYLVYTLNFAIKFNRANAVFNSNQMLLHNILIWIIPFLWIMIVKAMSTPTPGSYEVKKKKGNAGFHESGIGIFGHEDSSTFHNETGGNH